MAKGLFKQNVYVVVCWDSAEVFVFHSLNKAHSFLDFRGLLKVDEKAWATSIEAFNRGEYYTLQKKFIQ